MEKLKWRKNDRTIFRERVVDWKHLVQEKGYIQVYMNKTRQWKGNGQSNEGLCGYVEECDTMVVRYERFERGRGDMSIISL